MNGSDNRLGEVLLFVDGKKLDTFQPMIIEKETIPSGGVTIESGDSVVLSSGRGVTMNLKNVQMDVSAFFPYDKTFRVEYEGYKFPKGKKMPKSKRLRKKWKKKYFHKGTIEDCRIIGKK